MTVSINGESRRLDNGTRVSDLILQLGLAGKRLAVELNGELLPRSQHQATTLKPGDNVEIVHAVGGG